jgi:uncharacterized protein with GYD domain
VPQHTNKEIEMPKYLVHANYTGEGMKGLIQEGGTRRGDAVEELFESLGGLVESYYFALGETDVFVIADLPDNATATAIALTVAAGGGAVVKTTVLLTPEEVDQAVKMKAKYRAPGK